MLNSSAFPGLSKYRKFIGKVVRIESKGKVMYEMARVKDVKPIVGTDEYEATLVFRKTKEAKGCHSYCIKKGDKIEVVG